MFCFMFVLGLVLWTDLWYGNVTSWAQTVSGDGIEVLRDANDRFQSFAIPVINAWWSVWTFSKVEFRRCGDARVWDSW